MQTVTSITAEGVEWQWKSFDRAAAIARAVPARKDGTFRPQRVWRAHELSR